MGGLQSGACVLCTQHTNERRLWRRSTQGEQISKTHFLFSTRDSASLLLRHRTAPAREPWGALGMVGMWAVAARRGT